MGFGHVRDHSGISTSVISPIVLEATRFLPALIGESEVGDQDLHDALISAPLGGKFSLDELRSAVRLLEDLELIKRDGATGRAGLASGVLEASRWTSADWHKFLATLMIERDGRAWIRVVVRENESVHTEYVPEPCESLLAIAFPDPVVRERILLQQARKFDEVRLNELGAAGEEGLVKILKHELSGHGLADEVAWVSRVSDSLGYDITAPRLDGSTRRIEVKAVSRMTTKARFFLSRNEFQVGLSDLDWCLAVVLVAQGQTEMLGWLTASMLSGHAPLDCSGLSSWATARFLIPLHALRQGSPGGLDIQSKKPN